MGCDIHTYIEFARKDDPRPYWMSFGNVWIGRDYTLFGALAGVRHHDISPVVSPRGMPEDASFEAAGDYWLRVVEEKDDSQDHTCTREQAERWVKSGCSVWHPDTESLKVLRISGPDWHTASWVNEKEFEQAVRKCKQVSSTTKAALAAMKALARGGYSVRMVFWFDN